MRVTMLLDNIAASPALTAEHGLSLFIETAERRILFDTGKTDAFARNAEILGIDLATVDMAVISHGHYDHTGGIVRFLELNDHAPVYVQSEAFGHFEAESARSIGIAPAVVAALRESGRLVLTDDATDLGGGLSLHSCNAEKRPFASQSGDLFMIRDGRPVQDEFRHEQYLSIREHGDGGKHVLISGCSHKGIRNIVQWFRPDALIGGFHFMNVGLDAEGHAILDSAADALSAYDTEYFTCHCTGKAQFDRLKERMGERLHYLAGGMSVEL
jgi:7,8-dihydropterin-6-yl-methyl-4-(beta-D-ribofuranosyl)aminobenzene 5'-phosphate synthase